MDDGLLGDEPYIIVKNATPIRDIFMDKAIGIRTVVGITCGLSIIGSLLIIISYIVQKKRPKVREILVHISLMDLGVSLANLIGVTVYFDQHYKADMNGIWVAPTYINNMCKTQAFFAAYCTLGSVYWTTALAGYLYIIIQYHKKPQYSIYFTRFCYIFCYGLALGIALWLVLTNKLGYAPYDSSGWCSLIAKDPTTGKNDMLIAIFAHDLWMALSIFLIIVLCVATKSFLSNQLKVSNENDDIHAKKFWSSMNFVDYKFIMIPLFFVLLRVWSLLQSVLVEYAHIDNKYDSAFWNVLFYLAGIGDSGQGITNAILFILFTKSARDSFIRFMCCKCHGSAVLTSNSEGSSPSSVHRQRTTHYGSSDVSISLFKSMAGNTTSVNYEANRAK